MDTNIFTGEIQEILNCIDEKILSENLESIGSEVLYQYALDYARSRQLKNTCIALPLIRYLMAHAAQSPNSRFHAAAAHAAYFQHAMNVCRMLIDLQIPVSPEDEDILLAVSICHILPENIAISDLAAQMTKQYHLHPEVARNVLVLFWEDNKSGPRQKSYYDQLQQNRLALLVKLADRGNLVEQLYGISSWTARSHIHETKAFFFPMCIYAKEKYPELIAPVSVMLEKMRTLMEVAEILLSRYETREASLSQEILEIQEENATLHRMIHHLKTV